MFTLLSKSNLLRWGYRLALIAAVLGFLASLEVAYVDMLDGELDRATAGAALALSSVVLAVSVVLGRRLRRRNKDLARRLDKLEQTDKKIVKYMLALPRDLERNVLGEIESQFGERLGHLHSQLEEQQEALDTAQSELHVRDVELQKTRQHETVVLERAVELLGAAMSMNGGVSGRLDQFRDCQQLSGQLREMGYEVLAEELRSQVAEAQGQIQTEFRQQFVEALREQKWLVALKTGQRIRAYFPESGMARDFLLLEPRIAKKIQKQINDRRTGKSGLTPEPVQREQFNDAELAELSASLTNH